MEQEPPFRCFGCHALLSERTRFCPHCGLRLDSGVGDPIPPNADTEEVVLYPRERPRLVGVPPQDTMLVVGVACGVLAALLLVAGRVPAGAALAVASLVLLLAFALELHRRPRSTIARWVGMVVALARAEVRFSAKATATWTRTRTAHLRLRRDTRALRRSRRAHVVALGEAVYLDDAEVAETERSALQTIDAGVSAKDAERARLQRQAQAQIRAARASRDRSTAEARRRAGATSPVGAR